MGTKVQGIRFSKIITKYIAKNIYGFWFEMCYERNFKATCDVWYPEHCKPFYNSFDKKLGYQTPTIRTIFASRYNSIRILQEHISRWSIAKHRFPWQRWKNTVHNEFSLVWRIILQPPMHVILGVCDLLHVSIEEVNINLLLLETIIRRSVKEVFMASDEFCLQLYNNFITCL